MAVDRTRTDQDTRLFRIVRREGPRPCVGPISNIHDYSHADVFVIRLTGFHDIETTLIEEISVIAKYSLKLRKDRIILRNHLALELF
jgi:hypothetical protein